MASTQLPTPARAKTVLLQCLPGIFCSSEPWAIWAACRMLSTQVFRSTSVTSLISHRSRDGWWVQRNKHPVILAQPLLNWCFRSPQPLADHDVRPFGCFFRSRRGEPHRSSSQPSDLQWDWGKCLVWTWLFHVFYKEATLAPYSQQEMKGNYGFLAFRQTAQIKRKRGC